MNVWQGGGGKTQTARFRGKMTTIHASESLGQVLDSASAVVTNSQGEREGLIKGALRGK